jgi:hypothetical protein
MRVIVTRDRGCLGAKTRQLRAAGSLTTELRSEAVAP